MASVMAGFGVGKANGMGQTLERILTGVTKARMPDRAVGGGEESCCRARRSCCKWCRGTLDGIEIS